MTIKHKKRGGKRGKKRKTTIHNKFKKSKKKVNGIIPLLNFLFILLYIL